jgi:hypothetical protein
VSGSPFALPDRGAGGPASVGSVEEEGGNEGWQLGGSAEEGGDKEEGDDETTAAPGRGAARAGSCSSARRCR